MTVLVLPQALEVLVEMHLSPVLLSVSRSQAPIVCVLKAVREVPAAILEIVAQVVHLVHLILDIYLLLVLEAIQQDLKVLVLLQLQVEEQLDLQDNLVHMLQLYQLKIIGNIKLCLI